MISSLHGQWGSYRSVGSHKLAAGQSRALLREGRRAASLGGPAASPSPRAAEQGIRSRFRRCLEAQHSCLTGSLRPRAPSQRPGRTCSADHWRHEGFHLTAVTLLARPAVLTGWESCDPRRPHGGLGHLQCGRCH